MKPAVLERVKLSLSQKPVTVLGGEGFVGSHLIKHLKKWDVNPFVPKRRDHSYFEKDLGIVFYCIGLTADYAERPFDTVEAHTTLLAKLLKDVKFERLVYLSSTRLYDSGEGQGKENQDLTLNPFNPRHSYDLSKALGEWLCVHASRDRAKVARLASVYADDLKDNNFLHQTIRRAREEAHFALDTAPQYARDYVHMSDVCGALCAIATVGKEAVYNVASGHNLSNKDLFKKIKAVNGANITATQDKPDVKAAKIDVTLLQKEFGIIPGQVKDHLAQLLGASKIKAAGA